MNRPVPKALGQDCRIQFHVLFRENGYVKRDRESIAPGKFIQDLFWLLPLRITPDFRSSPQSERNSRMTIVSKKYI
jgi:hypothetical protein